MIFCFSGFVAERVSLRYFLAFGMILSGVASYLLGLAHTYEIHSLPYFIIVQVINCLLRLYLLNRDNEIDNSKL